MIGQDTPETCRGWRNILRINCASSWFFSTQSKCSTSGRLLHEVLLFVFMHPYKQFGWCHPDIDQTAYMETSRRHCNYNWKTNINSMHFFLFLITYVYHSARFKKRKIFQTHRYRHQKQAQFHIRFAEPHPALRTYKGIFFNFQAQTLPDVHSSYVLEGLAKIEFCANWNLLRTWSTTYVYITKSSWNPKHRNTDILSATTWGPNRLCYRPAVFFRHPLLAAFSFPQQAGGGDFSCAFKRKYCFMILYFFKKLRRPQIA